MLKKITLIDYKKEVYKIFIDQDNLYYSVKDEMIMLGEYVKDYCVKYFNESIWIAFYDEKYKIYLVEISLKYNKKIKKHLHMNGKRYSLYIDSLDMIITNEDKINLIFRGWDKEKTFLFNCKVKEDNKINIISDEINIKSKIPFITYSYENKASILFSEKASNEEYIIYDLLNNTIISNFKLFNIKSIFLKKYNGNPIIFYIKKLKNSFEIKYRYLNVDNTDDILKDENDINLSRDINNPIISLFMNKVYIIWNDKNGINIAKSYNLKDWDLNICKNTLIEGSLIKIIDNKAETLDTYFNEKVIENYIYNKNSKNNELISLIGDDIVENKISYINKISNLTRKYNKKYNEYLRKINELNKIIDEKDKLIVKLLSKKR